MIIIKLQGGLGNQLFQYAMGRSLCLPRNIPMKMDAVSGFRNDAYGRTYSLGAFNVVENFASEGEISAINRAGIGKYLDRSVNVAKPYYRRSVVIEPVGRQFAYDKHLGRVKDHSYLVGYWQHEQYFIGIEDTIRREFTLRSAPDPVNQGIAQEIVARNSVCVHVRRLHGVSHDKKIVNAKAVELHGACSLEYYHRAIDELACAVTEPHLVVFSDDHRWAQEHIKTGYPVTFVTHNDAAHACQDLWLMTLCKHYIIANSSLSWWGAWLSCNREKMVFAPKRWDTLDRRCGEDIVPPSWRRIQ